MAVERKCSVPGGVAAAGKKMVSGPWCLAVSCCCFLRLRTGAGRCLSSNGAATGGRKMTVRKDDDGVGSAAMFAFTAAALSPLCYFSVTWF